MSFNKENIHPFKRKYIENILNNKKIINNCKEIWLFGSTVKDFSDKQHTAFSNIDLAIEPLDKENIPLSKCCYDITIGLIEALDNNGIMIEHDII